MGIWKMEEETVLSALERLFASTRLLGQQTRYEH